MILFVISSVRTSFRSAVLSEAVSASMVLPIIKMGDFAPRRFLESSLAKALGNLSREPHTIET